MHRSRIALVSIAVCATFSLTACDSAPLAKLTDELAHTSTVDENILKTANEAKAATGLSAADTTKRTNLLLQVDALSLRSAYESAQNAGTSASASVESQVTTLADSHLQGAPNPDFVKMFEDVTKEMIKDKACALILARVAPQDRDTADPGEAATWASDVDEAANRLQQKFSPPPAGWNAVVRWVDWADGVVAAATQVSTSVVNGTTDVTLFSRPPVARAAIAYARYCYATPKDLPPAG